MNDEVKYFKSSKFKKAICKQIKKDTWDKELPMYYMDKDGWLVEHWKTGIIKKIKYLKSS